MASRTQLRLDQITGSLGNAPGKVHDGLGVGEATLALTTLQSGSMIGLMSEVLSSIKRIHGQDTFANNAIGEFKTDVVPEADGTRDLGSSTKEWAEVHANNVSSAAAFTLAGSAGVGMTSTTFDVDASGAMTLDAATLTIGGDNDTGAIAVDSTAGISLDGAGASNLSTSDGTLTIEAGGSDDKLVLKGDHESDVAIHIDGNAAVGSIVDIDAGQLDIDASDWVKIDAADEIEISTTSADGHISLVSAHTNGVAFHIDANANAASEVQIDAGILDVDVTGAATLDAGGDMTLTGARVILTGSSGDDSVLVQADATFSGNAIITGDLTVNGTTTTLDTTNLLVEDPIVVLNKNNSSANGQGGIAIEMGGSSLDMVFGRVANDTWGVGTLDTSGGTATTVAGMTLGALRSGKLEIDGANDHIDVDTDLKITAAADIVLTAGGADVLPGADKTHGLGSSAAQWKALFVGQSTTGTSEVAMKADGLGIFLDDDTDSGLRAAADDDIRIVNGGADVLKIITASMEPIADDYFHLGGATKRFKAGFIKTVSSSAGLVSHYNKNGTQRLKKDNSGNLEIMSLAPVVRDGVLTSGLLYLSDGFFSGSTLADGGDEAIPLSTSRVEWDDFESNFGEVSLINAINQARTGNPGAGKFSTELTAPVAAAADVTIANFDWSVVAAADRKSNIDVYVNGQLLLSGASGDDDYYLGTTADDLKFNFALVPDDVVVAIVR